MSQYFDVVIVGAGHAGAQAAISLRQAKFEGSIAIVGDEPDLPYERPPLSKDYLSGEKTFDRILIRPPAFWPDRNVSMLLSRSVISVDATSRTVMMSDQETVRYGKLIWAAGGSPRKLTCSGHDLAGVHSVRTRGDVDGLVEELTTAKHVVVVGGGYIGLEAAAILIKSGKRVTVLEAQDRILSRVAGETLSRFFEQEHRNQGVEIRLGVHVECIEANGDHVGAVRLANGDTVACDIVVVGIGIAPSVAPLIAAGANGGNGVLVDSYCQTSLPDVYAIGDCALHANRFAQGELTRVESVQNANDQASVAASHISGQPKTYESVPWFWSNQYDLRLQTVGLSSGHDMSVIRGDPAARSFSIVYLREGKVIALDCVNATRDYAHGRALVERGAELCSSQITDTAISLKDAAAVTS